MKKEVEIILKWKNAERIARYYRFPTAVFLMNSKNLKRLKGTRKEKFAEAYEKLQKIKEILSEVKQG